jgi:hypothetical protein
VLLIAGDPRCISSPRIQSPLSIIDTMYPYSTRMKHTAFATTTSALTACTEYFVSWLHGH